MGLKEKISQTKEEDLAGIAGSGPPLRSTKAGKERSVRVTIYPQGGGGPYEEDVTPDGEGVFTVNDQLTFKITKGSVWRGLDGLLHATVYEGNAQTVSISSLAGDDLMHPIVAHGLVGNNLVRQFNDMQKEQSQWKQASTWIYLMLGFVAIGMILWQIKTLGEGFEALADALRNIDIPAQNGPGGGGTAGDGQSGHNRIGSDSPPSGGGR